MPHWFWHPTIRERRCLRLVRPRNKSGVTGAYKETDGTVPIGLRRAYYPTHLPEKGRWPPPISRLRPPACSTALASSSISTARWSILLIGPARSEEHTSELQSLMRISYAVFCLKKTTTQQNYTMQITYNNIYSHEHYKIISKVC